MTPSTKSKFFAVIWAFNAIALAIILLVGLFQTIPFDRLSNLFQEEELDRGLIVGDIAERAENLNVNLQHLTYESPTRINNTEYFYSPVVVMDKDLPQKTKDMINSAADISIYMVGAAINILFFNEDRTEVRKLLPENGYIGEYRIGIDRYEYSTREYKSLPFAIYQIALSDDNGDFRINDKDMMPYYLSDLDGNNLRQITPDTLNLSNVWFSDNYNEIYFDHVEVDKNKPLVYEGYYEKTRTVYYYNLKTNEFNRFDALQNEFNDIQNTFKNLPNN